MKSLFIQEFSGAHKIPGSCHFQGKKEKKRNIDYPPIQ
jgi:hypothetical protein